MKKVIPKFTAFTLLELLVVISVISMLMAIMMPSLNRAKEAGKSVVCLSNLHELNLAWTMYASENDEEMCSSDTDWNGIQPWDGKSTNPNNFWVSDGPGSPFNEFCNTETAIQTGVLWPYLEMLDVYRCPRTSKDFIRSYAISHAMGSCHNRNGEWSYYSISEIPLPSQKMVFVDHPSPFRAYTGMMQNTGSSVMIDTYSKTWSGPLTCRHNNGTNMSFVDGRAEHWKWKDRRTIKVMNGEMGSEDASIDNPDITQLLPAIRGARDRQF